ncbi:MAG: hypothetical protein QNJ91_15310 [Gammaproteobacteria bacterium]|nr:hypothetical protein [Gammaproteobacteria bacterium]
MPRHTLSAVLIGLALAAPAAIAADQAQLLDELRGIVEKSRQERAADRWLQRALEDLLAKHDQPPPHDLLYEDFRDGDYSRNPSWQVLSGDFRVVRGQGLVGTATAVGTTPTATGDAPPQSATEALSGLIVGALLDQALGPSQAPADSPAADPPASAGGPAEIRVEAGAGNAFALDIAFRAGSDSDFAIALLQSEAGRYGYRLHVAGGARGGIELQRIRRGNGAVVDSHALARPIDDGALHDLRWQQRSDGTVSVALDGETLLQVSDRAFRDPYPWLTLRIDRGELTVRSLRVSGA